MKGCAALKKKVIDMKKTNWSIIFKIVIAVVSAVAGALGVQAMTF